MSMPDDKYGNEQWTEEGYVYDLYVNSRNPFDPKETRKKKPQSLGSERYLSCLFMEERRGIPGERLELVSLKETAGC